MTNRNALNQCDGCRRGLPVKDGLHDLTGEVGSYPGEKMWCTKELYKDDPPYIKRYGENDG